MRGGYEMSSTCIQGGLPRNLGGYHQPNIIMEPHSPASAWQFHPTIPKQEPMEDSGINSGSDCQSSSPGSESEVYSTSNNNVTPSSNRSYYSTPIMPRNGLPIGFHSNMQNMPLHMMYNHTPISPPLIEEVSSPKDSTSSHMKEIKKEFLNDKEPDSTLTPCKSPILKTTESDCDDPLRRLQMTLEKNGLTQTPLSPKVSEHSMDDDNKSENDLEEYDEHGLRVPRINSHGKVKTFKCKQCDFVAITKLDFWEHTKSHIKADKLLTCPKCPFVTEYKHHLEYHLRNHVGSKPFKCDKCSYSCVNKSMLNSHLKSHSNVYQYRCSDCSYATKYCHSLKLHLRKYSHKPAMVLNPDGSPNPLPIIDVYGTRRGPKLKQSNEEEMQSQKETPLLPFPLQQLMMNPPPMHLPFAYPWLPGSMIFQNLEKLARGGAPSPEPCELEHRNEQADTSSEVLDLSKDSGETSHKNRRKGPAFKLDHLVANTSDEDDDEDMSTTTVFENVQVVQNDDRSSGKEKQEIVNNNNKVDDYSCQYCNIAFGDPVLYTMHMGYHGYKNPFTCNMCGEECKDKISFFLHIARTPHS